MKKKKIEGEGIIFFQNNDTLFLPFVDSPSDGSDEDRHKRTQQIKEAIRQIRQRRDTQYCRLCHTTSIPGDQYRGHCGGIFSSSAQQALKGPKS